MLVDALGVDEDEVTPDATLRDDLGAESIDFLDIVFRLEKAFTTDPTKPFKIPRGELFPEDLRLQNDPNFVQDGKITARRHGRAEEADAVHRLHRVREGPDGRQDGASCSPSTRS